MEDDAAEAASPKEPTAEDVAGSKLRMLRQGRGWTQQEVANRMRKRGYSWQQSTIGKIETAQRPLRLNELADLAAALGVPVTHFLSPGPAPDEGTDLRMVEREIRERLLDRMNAAERAAFAESEWFAAGDQAHAAKDAVGELDSRLQTLRQWHPSYDEIARDELERLAEANAADRVRRSARWWSASDDAILGWTPEVAREKHMDALLRPYAVLLAEDQMDRIREIYEEAVDAAMREQDR